MIVARRLIRRRAVVSALAVAAVATVVLAGVLVRAASAPAAVPGPWIIESVFSAPPFNDRELQLKCEARGRNLVHYTGKYTGYSCARDAPYYWRLWMQLKIPY